MNRTEFSLQLVNYLTNQTGTNLTIIIENFLIENNLVVSNRDDLATAGGWSVSAIYDYLSNDEELNLTIDDARAIWESVSDKANADLGVTPWEIRYWATEYFKNNE